MIGKFKFRMAKGVKTRKPPTVITGKKVRNVVACVSVFGWIETGPDLEFNHALRCAVLCCTMQYSSMQHSATWYQTHRRELQCIALCGAIRDSDAQHFAPQQSTVHI